MSRFFAAGYSDSESSTDDEYTSEEELSSEEVEESSDNESSEESSDDDDDEGREKRKKYLVNQDEDSNKAEEKPAASKYSSRFLRGAEDSEDSSSEDEGKRIVKSAKDKRLDEIDAVVKLIENGKKINDWAAILNEFEKLNKLVSRIPASDEIPAIYIKTIAELEDDLSAAAKADKSSGKKMNAINARALNTTKQRLKKNNKQYEDLIAKYKADPEGFMSEAAEKSSSDNVDDNNDNEVKFKSSTSKSSLGVSQTPSDVDGFATIGKGGKTIQISSEPVLKQLRVILDVRGKKNVDRHAQISVLASLLDFTDITDYQRVRVLQALISARFDLNSGTVSYLPIDQWKLVLDEINELISLLVKNPSFLITEDVEDIEENDSKDPAPNSSGFIKIPGSLTALVERLDDEFTRSLQNIDPHAPEYLERLKDESSLYTLILRSQLYFENTKQQSRVEQIVSRRLAHLYFKPTVVITKNEEVAWSSLPNDGFNSKLTPKDLAVKDPSKLIHVLATILYHQSNSLMRTRAILSHIYHYALHDSYYQARNMFLMSHLQSSISNADIQTQVLYNRTLVQTGLCAFRNGLISDALQSLQEICGPSKAKELLAQGAQIQRYSQLSPEQERLEKQRLVPFHMHINLELLECAYLTCSMLMEIPTLAAARTPEARKKAITSRSFRRYLEYNDRQAFVGPPENMRDHVVQASKALYAGDWVRCKELILAIKIWELIPNQEKIKNMLKVKIQEEGLRTYIFNTRAYYKTCSLNTLAELFDLSLSRVKSIVSKMIFDEDIAAALDQTNDSLVFRGGLDHSRLQDLSLTLADKAIQLVESNERQTQQGHFERYPDRRVNHNKNSHAQRRTVRPAH